MEKWQADALKKASLVEAALSAGAISPCDVAKLYSERILVADDGTVDGISEIVEVVRQEKGHWFWPSIQKQNQVGTGGNPARK